MMGESAVFKAAFDWDPQTLSASACVIKCVKEKQHFTRLPKCLLINYLTFVIKTVLFAIFYELQ